MIEIGIFPYFVLLFQNEMNKLIQHFFSLSRMCELKQKVNLIDILKKSKKKIQNEFLKYFSHTNDTTPFN